MFIFLIVFIVILNIKFRQKHVFYINSIILQKGNKVMKLILLPKS